MTMATRQPPRGLLAARDPAERKIGVAGIIFLVVPVTTFCLGVWQYRRRLWKVDKIAELDQKVRRAEPVSLPSEPCEVAQMEYQRVKLTGRFDHSRELYIGPRSLLDKSGGTTGGIISSGEKVGWHVITPFQLEGESGQQILVNRGWVPRSRLTPDTRPAGQTSATTSIVGIIRLTEETSSLAPPNRVASDQWASRDVSALAARLGTSPIFVDLEASGTALEAAELGGPIPGQTRISLRNEHMQYMLTWFGLSAGTLFLWFKRFIF